MNTNGNFTKVPNELFQYYTQILGFNGDHIAMYMVLTSYYNEDYGYAFPDQYELMLRLNIGKKKVGKVAAKLREVGLIDYRRVRAGSNYVYFVKEPIKNAQEFYDKFPEALERLREVTEVKAEKKAEKNELADIIDWL